MNSPELIEKLKAQGVAPEPHLARYRELTTAPTEDGFLQYLRQLKVIDESQFKSLHKGGAVDATVVAATARSASASAAATATIEVPSAPEFMATAISAHVHGGAGAGAGADAEDDGATQYELLGELGKGAMGAVHLARDVVLRRKVALKSILPEMQQHPQLLQRFIAEMQITAQLDHPFIVPIYGVNDGPGGGLAYSMKVVEGRELGDLLDETQAMLSEGKLLPPELRLEARLEAFVKVCDAIAYAHERGVVHRDLKPGNIMLGPFNVVYVMDWGISRLMGDGGKAQDQGIELMDAEGGDAAQATRTRVGSTIGTPIYMSPEQASGKNDELDGRSDLYALGLILQEVVTLKRAIGGTTLQEVLTNAKDGRRIAPEAPAAGANVPEELQAIVEKATRFNPNDRYATVTDFGDDIRRYLRNDEIKARPDTTSQRMGRWVSKHRMTTIALILSALVLGAGATIGVLLYNQRVVAQQYNRELRLAELQATSAVRTQELDGTLQGYEGLLSRMVGATDFALADAKEGESQLHFSDAFKSGPDAVPGLVESKYYGGLVSFDWPVASLAPGTPREVLTSDISAVNRLRTLARETMLSSLSVHHQQLSEADRQKALGETGVPISRISLTLENGLHIEYPGMAGLAPDYDGRKQPEYIATSRLYEAAWGKPQKGRQGGMVLPVSAPLRDRAGKLQGVLSFDVDLTRAVAIALAAPAGPHVESSLLVDRTGKVLAQENQPGTAPEAEVLAMPKVNEAIARGESGYLQTERAGHPVIVTYQPLATVGWYLVTAANVDTMKKGPAPAGARPGSVAAKPAVTAEPAAKAAPPPAATPTPEPTTEPTEEPSAEPPASAAPSASAPALWGKLPTAAPSAPPPPPPPASAPPNPFDPWDAYKGDKKP
jgi:serine/threonine-protein kinase